MATTCAYNVFVGAETGLLKGIQTAERTWQNLNSTEDSNRSREVTCLCWGTDEKTELCAGLRDNCVLTFDAAGVSASEHGPFFGASGHIKTITKYGNRFLTGFSGGVVAVWSGDGNEEDEVKISTGDNLWTLAQNSAEPNLIATGGKENPLKLWDINNSQEPVFTSKNVRNDWLNLRVPIWVTKVQFCGNSQRMVTTTGYSQVRVYDPQTCRRPVIDFEVFKSTALTALSVCPLRDEQVIVGTTKGDMALIDLRKREMVHQFRGFSGGITDIQCHSAVPVVVSTSIDRFVRIHDTESKALLDKFYLKSRLNCLLLSDEWPQNEEENQRKKNVTKETEVKETENNDSEADDAMWESLGEVNTKTVSEGIQPEKHQKRKMKEEGKVLAEQVIMKPKGQKKRRKKKKSLA